MTSDTGTSGNELVTLRASQEGRPNLVSFQVLQAIYHEITGKTEALHSKCMDPIILSLESLNDLDNRIKQFQEQYHIKAATCCVAATLRNRQKLDCSSFEKFTLLAAGGSNEAIESLSITYNMLIILPKTNVAQSYTITIRTVSRLAMINRMKSEMSSLPRIPAKVLRIMVGPTMSTTVNFVDFVVATSLMSLIQTWSDGLARCDKPGWIVAAQRNSHWFPRVSKTFFGAAGLIIAVLAVDRFLPSGAGNDALARFQMTALASIFILYTLAEVLGERAESAIDAHVDASSICITAGDKRLHEEFVKQNRSNIIRFLAMCALNVLLGIAASVIAASIT